MKAYEIPVSSCVLKMLKRDYEYSHHMLVKNMVFGKCIGDPTSWRRYLEAPQENQVMITLVSRYLSVGKRYTIARLMEYEFQRKMQLYVEAAVECGMPAQEAINRFMDKYDLSDDDLSMETAYKRWQRYKSKEQERNLIPLW